jgi:hypothetical protein
VANNFNKTKKHLESEIDSLKKKLEDKDDNHEKENFERLKFNEGSFWMSNKLF